MGEVNYLAVAAAAASMFLIGGLWYSPLLFHGMWMKANGFKETDVKGGEGKIFGLAFLLSLLMAANLGAFLAGPNTTIAWGATAGLLAGLGWVALGIGIVALFERRSWTYILVNGGYFVVSFTVMGAILGAWR